MHKATDEQIVKLIDERRKAAAKVAGIDIEIALALGDRDAARKHMREMYAQVEARISAREACNQERGNG